jgi:hypothetical protein
MPILDRIVSGLSSKRVGGMTKDPFYEQEIAGVVKGNSSGNSIGGFKDSLITVVKHGAGPELPLRERREANVYTAGKKEEPAKARVIQK